MVRGSVEETLNELLEKEAESLTQAARYERSEARQGYRRGHYNRNLTTTSGDVTLHVPRLKGVSFDTTEIYYYGDDLTDALVYLEEFAPDIERSEFERRVCNLFENKWMIDLIDKAMSKVYDYYNNGRLYHEILSKSYLTAFRYTESDLLEILNLERSIFYDRKKEAVMLLGTALWGYAIPVFRGIFEVEGDESEIPDFFYRHRKVRPLSDESPMKIRPISY